MDILNGCDICGENHATELCPELGLNNASVHLYQLSTKARLTLPGFVEVIDDGNGFVGVVAKSTIPNKTQFGPYEAKRTTHIFDDTGFFTLKVIGKDGTTVCLDTTDENECNWLCLIRAAISDVEKNCIAYQLGGNIFYNTTRDIGVFEELQVWYAPHFAKKLGKPPIPDGASRVLLGHRIEPLTSDLLLCNDSQTVNPQALNDSDNTQCTSVVSKHPAEFPLGEIKKAFYCPRCGNTFPNQTEMVQHLREHVLAASNKPKRSVGRPRKDGKPNEGKSNAAQSLIQISGRGRPRKSILESVLTSSEFRVKPPSKFYGRKRKTILDENIEHGDDDDDFGDESTTEYDNIGNDHEYTPRKEMSVKSRRVQPRRSTRGHHSKFDEDYVLFTIKKEKNEKTATKMDQDVEILSMETGNIKADTQGDLGAVTVAVIKKASLITTTDLNGSVTTENGEISNEIAKAVVDKIKCLDDPGGFQEESKCEMEQENSDADRVMEKSLVEADTDQNNKEELAYDSPVEMKLSTDEQNATSDNSGPVTIRRNVTTAEKGSMIVMFEETKDGKYSCVLCEEVFVEESVAVAHFMIHDNSHIKCKNCGTSFESIDELLKHRTNCKSNNADCEEPLNGNEKLPYVCDICLQAFKTPQYLFRHMVIHTDVFKCEKCEKTFSRKDSMQKHVLKCCPELAQKYKIYYCEVCFRVFSKESGRRRHVEKCKSVQCNTCNKIFSSQSDMAIHSCKSMESDDTAKYCCGRCSKAFQSLYYLKQHQSLHDNNHACNRCGKNFSSPDELMSHTNVCETLEGIRLYGSGVCLICKQTFSNSKLFKNHHLTHTHPFHCEKCDKHFLRFGLMNSHECEKQKSSEWVCSVCNKPFKHQANLDKHIRESGCTKYQCSVCNEQFHTKLQAKDHSCIVDAAAEVEAHIVSRVQTKEICPRCGKWFSNRSNLSKHMILHGEKKLACPHCPKKFHLDVYLREHITCVHFKIFKYQCNECGRLLKSKTGLIAHNRIFHAKNAETYPCNKCGKVFKQKGNLRAHMFSHSTERKFKCELCTRAFKYPDQLSRHKIEHKLLPKLKCSHCEKEFLRSYDLKKHLQVYHSGYIYICGVCGARCGHRHTLVRHYKRKHPESVHLTRQTGYLDGLLKHVDELYDADPEVQNGILATRKFKIEKVAADIENVEHIIKNAEMLPEDAAEALHSLSIGQATAKQFQLLKDKGLFIQTETGIIQEPNGSMLEDQSQVVVPQDSYIFEGQSLEQAQMIESTEEVATSTSESLGETIGMVQNADGTISINGIHSIPQTIENSKAQIVILQIYPGPHQQQGEIILDEEHVFEGNSGEILANAGQVLGSGSEILPHSHMQTILIENGANQVSSNIDLHVAGHDNISEVEETVNETPSSSDIPETMNVEEGIQIEDGDPNIQAPMVYSQDVSCSE